MLLYDYILNQSHEFRKHKAQILFVSVKIVHSNKSSKDDQILYNMYIYTKELRMSDFLQTDLIEAFLKDFFRAGYWTIKTHFNECVYNMKIKRNF